MTNPNNSPKWLPNPVPAHLSYSQVSGINTCGERYRLERVFKIPQVPRWALVGGSAFHESTEALDLFNAGQLVVDNLTHGQHCPDVGVQLGHGDDRSVKVSGLDHQRGYPRRADTEVNVNETCTTERRSLQDIDPVQSQRGASRVDETTYETVSAAFRALDAAISDDGATDDQAPQDLPDVQALGNLFFEKAIREEIERSARNGNGPGASKGGSPSAPNDSLRTDAEPPDPKGWVASGRASKLWPDKEDRSWWEHHLPLFLTSWFTWRKQSGYTLAERADGSLAREMDVSAEIGGIQIQAYLDAVFLDRAANPTVVDLKTSSRLPSSPEQLGLYSVLLEEHGFPRPLLGAYWMARTGELSDPYDLTRYNRDYFEYKYNAVKVQRDDGVLLPNPDSGFCKSCAVQEFCWAKGGAKADLIPRPWELGPLPIKN